MSGKLAGKKLAKQSCKKEREGFPGGSVIKNLPANAGDMSVIPNPGRSYLPRNN